MTTVDGDGQGVMVSPSTTTAEVLGKPVQVVADRRWVLLVILSAADFLVTLDATVVNIALPSIQSGLSLSEANLQWVISAYVLLFGSALLAWGRIGDAVGHKPVFLGGVLLFSGASLLCGIADSAVVILACRGIQGIGAAMVAPSALALVTLIFKDEAERTRALAVWGGMAATGAAAGLVLGGLVTAALSWRWIFLINVPIGAMVLGSALALLPAFGKGSRQKSIDWLGMGLVTTGLIALTYAVARVPALGWTALEVVCPGVVGVLLLGCFAFTERRADVPLVSIEFFERRKSVVGIVGSLLAAAGLFSVFYFASIYAQDVLGYSPLKAGIAFLPVAAAIALGSYAADRLVSRIGCSKTALFGLGLSLMGVLWLIRLSVDGNYAVSLLPGLVAVFLGMGISYVPLMVMATSVAAEDEGLASGMVNAASNIGGAIGLALVVSVAAERTANAAAGGATGVHALVEGYRLGFVVCAGIVLLGIVLVAVLGRRWDANEIGEV